MAAPITPNRCGSWRLTLTISLLLGAGVVAGRQLVNHAAYYTEFSASPAAAASRIAPLLNGFTARDFGDVVFLNDVALNAGPRPELFIVADNTGTQMLVAWDAPKGFQYSNSTTVDVQGTLRQLPTAEVLEKVWKLTKNQAEALVKQKVYISAESVQKQRQDLNPGASTATTPPAS